MLRAQGLRIEAAGGGTPILRGVDLQLPVGSLTALLGASGSGKTVLARALSGLLPDGLRVAGGRIDFNGRVLAADADWDGIRGRSIFYAPQNAAACLNPVMTVGRQIAEALPPAARSNDAGNLGELLRRLQIADPGRILRSYPHQLSGGECQRSLLAMALASGAGTLLLDEPTAEIDLRAQEEFMAALAAGRRQRPLAVLLITHQLGGVRAAADRLAVLADGALVAAGRSEEVLAAAVHPYVRALAAGLATP